MSEDSRPTLKKAIGLHHATAMVVGTIIGASIFVQQAEITGRIPTASGSMLVWLVAGVLTFMGAQVIAELASTFPRSGGVYVFLKEAFSPALGFLWGWAMFWTMHSGIIAAISMVFARFVAYFVPLGELSQKGVAISAILLLSWINYLGVRQGSNLQTAFTLVKVLAVVLIIGVGFSLGEPAGALTAAPTVTGVEAGILGGGTMGDFFLALVAGLFAFGGWHMVSYNAGETIEARKTIPKALTYGVFVVTASYIALNAVYFYVLPLDTVIQSDRVAADAANAVLGSGGGAFMSGLVLFSVFGALSGIILAGPRVYYAMARDGLLFSWLGEVHPQRRSPHRAIALQALWASVLVGWGSYRWLFTRVVYTEWIFFGLLGIAIFLFRRREGLRREYSLWGYPIVPAVFTLSAFAIVINQIIADPKESLTGLGFVLLGLPVYYLWGRKRPVTQTDQP